MNVHDLMKLPSMKDARVLTGKRQMDRLITTISVLEVSDPDAYDFMPTNGEYSGNEIVLTSLVQVANDVDKQLRLIDLLYRESQLAIVLYYVGTVIPELDPRLLQRLNELDQLVIVMPENRMDLRYSEVISEVLTFIDSEDSQLETEQELLLETIKQVPDEQLPVETALSILSDQLKCSLLVSNTENEIILSKAWPRQLDATFREILTKKRLKKRQNAVLEYHQRIYFHTMLLLDLPNFGQYNLTVFRTTPLTDEQVASLKFIVEATMKYFGEDRLLNRGQHFFLACQRGDIQTANSYAAKAGFDLSKACDTFCFQKNTAVSAELAKRYTSTIRYETEEFEWLVGNPAITGSVEEIFADKELSFAFAGKNVADFKLVQAWMQLLREDQEQLLKKVFPERECYFPQDLYSIRDVRKEEREYQYVFQQLKETELLETLAAYFLDYGESINLTSKHLYLHNNTIKYRLNRAEERLEMSFKEGSTRYFLWKCLIYYRKFYAE